MKSSIFTLLFACSLFSYGQVKIGNDVSIIDQFSILELESNSKALILTRVTDSEMLSMQPLNGALVYNTEYECVYFFNGLNWSNLCDDTGSNTSEASLVDNENGTFTFTDGNNIELTFYGAPDRITTLTDNLDGTFTYINENNTETTIAFPADSFSGSFLDLTNIPLNLDTDSTDDFSGAFPDLSGVPLNLDLDSTDDFSGSFNDLIDSPANLDTDSTDDFSGNFTDLNGVPVNLDTDSTDDFSGSFNDLTDVPTDITDGDNDTTYSAGNGLNLSGTEFSINNGQLAPDFANLTNVPTNLDTDSTDDFSGNFADLTGVPANLDLDSTDDFSGDFNDLSNVPINLDTDSTDDFSGNFNDLTDAPANLDMDSTDDFSGSFNDLSDVPTDLSDGDNDTTYSAGSGLNLSATEFSVNNSQLAPDFANLVNIPANLDTDSTDDFSGDFDDLSNTPVNLDTDSTDDFSGSFTDLTNVPLTLDVNSTDDFSGIFSDLNGVPTNLDTDSTDDFSGSFNDLADLPTDIDLDSTDDFSGDYNDLTNLPTSTSISGTEGSVFYADADGSATENNNDFFWDASTNRLGIGTNSPARRLHVGGQVRATAFVPANGSTANPSYRFNSDEDTGMYRAAANQLAFSTAGTEALRIDTSQNVGIGTTTPNSTLHTNGSLAVAILKTTGSLALNDAHHTIILGGNHSITLPSAATSTGRMYIIKNPTGSPVGTSNYLDEGGSAENEVESSSIIWLQSDGFDWQLINNISSSTGGGTGGGTGGSGITGTSTSDIVADYMDDGQNGTANSFTLNIRNTTGTALDYEILIENAPYATIPSLALSNHTYQVVDNGNGTYNHIFTSISSLGGFASRSISGGNNVQPPGSGLSCSCISFYEL